MSHATMGLVGVPRLLGADGPAAVRVVVALVIGIAAAVVVLRVGWPYAPTAGWICAAAVYVAWTWLLVHNMTAEQTKNHVRRRHEGDSTRAVSDLVVILASIGSLAGVGYLLAAESGGGLAAAIVGILSVAASWFTLHTIFALRYARLYYTRPGQGIDFHQDQEPDYLDFAYVAFTLGMTYQVSDTDLRDRAIRATALFHAMTSFLLGAVILAMTINLVGGLTGSGG